MKSLLILMIGALLAGILISSSDNTANSDSTISVDEDDIDMKSAIAKARESLSRFWQSFEHPQPGEMEFALKVRITDEYGTEYFWTSKIERKDGKITGTID